MAGGWGYEPSHYDVSIACGERVLLPKVREAPPETLIVANGFSCKSQIEQAGTGRQALHIAEVLELARGRESVPPYPERVLARPEPDPGRSLVRAAVAVGTAAALAGAALAYARA
jgi:hypothetical protein